MKARLKSVGKWVGLALLLLMTAVVGYSIAASQGGCGVATVQSAYDAANTATLKSSDQVAGAARESIAVSPSTPAPAGGEGVTASSPVAQDQMVITSASMNVQVKNLEAAVAAIRSASSSAGAMIADLSVSSGNQSGPQPRAAVDGKDGGTSSGPGSAHVVLRVPVDKLESLQAEIAKAGNVTAQNVSASDVTQQHVDMTARLANLRAEEARLRSFLDQAKTVGQMLEVEKELTRVRGEIESMQAQVDYLERQVALATLAVDVAAPGPIVQPGGTNWGFGEAVTSGVQAAAAMMRSAVTLSIALAPLALLGLVLWFAWRLIRRARNRRHREPGTMTHSETGTSQA